MVERLEIMHNFGLLHNDLKPQNMMAHYKLNHVILIDFGLTLNQNDTGKKFNTPSRVLLISPLTTNSGVNN